MKINMPAAVTARLSRQVLVAQKNSPKILFATGIALMGATVVTACQGTLKVEGVLDELRDDRDAIKSAGENHPERYTDRELSKLNAYVTIKGFSKLVKLYLPAMTLGVAAVACFTASHNILNRRNAGLSAALAATDRALKNYRERVVEELGEDKDREFMFGTEEREEIVTDAKGKEKVVKKTSFGHGRSPYAALWGRDTSSEWSHIPEYNLMKLRSVEKYATVRLNTRGHVFLNEVLDELGLDRTQAGAVVGWLKDSDGDGYVSLGILEDGDGDEAIRFLDFMTGAEDHLLLDFNVDGQIWDRI